MKLHHPSEHIGDAEQSLQLLREGNQRFVQGQLCDKSSYAMDREILPRGQHPFAAVLSCSDSRVVPEIFFDQRMGDLFVIRNAGNLVDDMVVACMEYAVEVLKCPLLVVCGHSHCGAMTAAHAGSTSLRSFQMVVDALRPSFQVGDSVEMMTKRSVAYMVTRLKDAVGAFSSKPSVVGAYYDIASGQVEWLADRLARGYPSD